MSAAQDPLPWHEMPAPFHVGTLTSGRSSGSPSLGCDPGESPLMERKEENQKCAYSYKFPSPHLLGNVYPLVRWLGMVSHKTRHTFSQQV